MWILFHNTHMFIEYFTDLWFSIKEAEIFKALYILGTKPASTISKYLWYERTSVYKILQRLVEENLVYETYKWWIKHFFIPSSEVLKKYSEKKTRKYEKLSGNYDLIREELREFEWEKDASIPKISLFDSVSGIANMHEDILQTTLQKKYISIRLFASNTVDSQVNISNEMKTSSLNLFHSLAEKKIAIETFLWNGIMLMESISKTFDTDAISWIPASNSAVNIYLVGEVIYIIIFKDSPFGIKIESEDLAGTLHFLFDKIEYKN